MQKLIELYRIIIHFLLGSKDPADEEDHVPQAPIEPEEAEPKPEKSRKATVEKPQKATKKKAAKKAKDKLLVVENAYPIREASATRRTITDTGDGYFRVNYKDRETGVVAETAYVQVKADGQLIVHDHTKY